MPNEFAEQLQPLFDDELHKTLVTNVDDVCSNIYALSLSYLGNFQINKETIDFATICSQDATDLAKIVVERVKEIFKLSKVLHRLRNSDISSSIPCNRDVIECGVQCLLKSMDKELRSSRVDYLVDKCHSIIIAFNRESNIEEFLSTPQLNKKPIFKKKIPNNNFVSLETIDFATRCSQDATDLAKIVVERVKEIFKLSKVLHRLRNSDISSSIPCNRDVIECGVQCLLKSMDKELRSSRVDYLMDKCHPIIIAFNKESNIEEFLSTPQLNKKPIFKKKIPNNNFVSLVLLEIAYSAIHILKKYSAIKGTFNDNRIFAFGNDEQPIHILSEKLKLKETPISRLLKNIYALSLSYLGNFQINKETIDFATICSQDATDLSKIVVERVKKFSNCQKYCIVSGIPHISSSIPCNRDVIECGVQCLLKSMDKELRSSRVDYLVDKCHSIIIAFNRESNIEEFLSTPQLNKKPIFKKKIPNNNFVSLVLLEIAYSAIHILKKYSAIKGTFNDNRIFAFGNDEQPIHILSEKLKLKETPISRLLKLIVVAERAFTIINSDYKI
uniref:Methyltranfer_dom domain-containing protein n=1 Tax=Rhabditophanes sp. KR3021 TaxID=114890 RepID=A0AC35TPC9_9BILA